MNKYLKYVIGLFAVTISLFSLNSCAALDSFLNDLNGDLVGNAYTIYTYDNYGQETLIATGNKINISGNRVKVPVVNDSGWGYSYDLSSVITITIDGKEMESCGDTCIFEGDGLTKEVDFYQDNISSNDSSGFDKNTSIAYILNQYKNSFGKSRIVVIKSQTGQPICAYSGDDVYWEIPDDLPKMTKLMIDGKPLYIHRANFQIIDKELLN